MGGGGAKGGGLSKDLIRFVDVGIKTVYKLAFMLVDFTEGV